MKLQVGDPSIDWCALQPQTDHKRVLLVEAGRRRLVGTTTEAIKLIEAEGRPALRRTQILLSDELGNREATTIVFRDTFQPYSHADITALRTLSLTYQGTTIVGERRPRDGQVIPIRKELQSPVFDAHSVEMILRVLPLADGYAVEIPIYHASRGEQMLVTAQVMQKGALTISDNAVEAWRVRTSWDDLVQDYWIASTGGQLLKQSSRLSEGVRLAFVRG